MDFEDTRAVVIGGSSGIGFATAQAIIERGGEVVIGARDDDDRLRATAELGPEADEAAIDIADPDSVEAFFEAVGEFDYLVCTPAYIPTGFDVSDDDLREAFDVKFFGYYYAATAAREYLAEDGAVVFITGEAAVDPDPQYFAIGVVNAAVETLTRYLAVEYAPIRVSAISPGLVDTFDMSEDMREKMADSVPVGRVAEPEDIAEAICFALTNPNTSGEVLRINGGASLV
jgi:NAD(P)-dependent dehydrogenase (short-subunit alcohol dehydrogenase family)